MRGLIAALAVGVSLSGCTVVPTNSCYYWPYCSAPVATVSVGVTPVVAPVWGGPYYGPWYNPYYPMSPTCSRRYGPYGNWRTYCW